MRFRVRRKPGHAAGRLRWRRPLLERLEDRLAPAVVGTLALSGTSLVYTGKAVTDDVTLSTNLAGALVPSGVTTIDGNVALLTVWITWRF